MIDIKTLALKHGANLFDDLYPDTTSVAFNDMVRFQAFADEYLAMCSSEPVYLVWYEDCGYAKVSKDMFDKETNEAMKWMLYEANPLNQQLLTERNECVGEIKRLREAMKIARGYANDVDDDYIVGLFDKALSTTDSIKKLLEEVK